MTGKKREKGKKKEERRRKNKNLYVLLLFALPFHFVRLVGSIKEAVAVRDALLTLHPAGARLAART